MSWSPCAAFRNGRAIPASCLRGPFWCLVFDVPNNKSWKPRPPAGTLVKRTLRPKEPEGFAGSLNRPLGVAVSNTVRSAHPRCHIGECNSSRAVARTMTRRQSSQVRQRDQGRQDISLQAFSFLISVDVCGKHLSWCAASAMDARNLFGQQRFCQRSVG
jgi:hypothetical protein